jgi:hypothetical protein
MILMLVDVCAGLRDSLEILADEIDELRQG